LKNIWRFALNQVRIADDHLSRKSEEYHCKILY